MAGGRAVASAAAVSLREKLPSLASIYENAGSGYARGWISGLLALPAAGSVHKNLIEHLSLILGKML